MKLTANVGPVLINGRLNPAKSLKGFVMVSFYLMSVSFLPQVDNTATLTVKVTKIQSAKGQILLAVFDNPDGFPSDNENMLTYKVKKPTGKTELSITISGLKPGKHAFSVLHDENSDFKMDRNFFGYPTEPYALSTNFHPLLSPPSFSDCEISLAQGPNSFSVELIN